MAIATKSNIPARVVPESFTLRLDLSAAEATFLRMSCQWWREPCDYTPTLL